jgi:hypothetical protein
LVPAFSVPVWLVLVGDAYTGAAANVSTQYLLEPVPPPQLVLVSDLTP